MKEIFKRFDEIEELILRQTIASKSVLTVDEASVYLDLKPNYIYKLTHRKIIPYHKPGGKKIYFRKNDLDQFLLEGHVDSKKDIIKTAYKLKLK
ncbi:MAG: helix-turn-helix domain-containing protein [Cytophagales bacterium]|nr:helix-turn-helix domain-containing protein [Cytophagales bacterium]